MVDCPEKFPLSWLNGMIDYDSTFAAEALIIRERIETYQPEHQRQTHTLASAAVGLVNHWLVQRDLNGYERGRLVDNFGELVVIPVEGCYSKGIASRQSSIFIVRDELVTLMQSHGMTIPTYLGGSGAKPAQGLTPAPAEDPAPAPVSVDQAERVRNGPPIKKAAFIAKYGNRFPNLSSAFADASRNELDAARVEGRLGMYYEGEALAWAESRAKQTGGGSALTLSMHNLFGKVYKQE